MKRTFSILIACAVAVTASSENSRTADFQRPDDAYSGAQQLPSPNSAPVALYGAELRDPSGEFVGRGVNIDGEQRERVKVASDQMAVVSDPCGGTAEIVWREVRRETDADGGSHVFYRQHVVGAELDAELVGSEIAVHRLPNGKVFAIGGRQFKSFTIEGCAKLNAAQAARDARRQVRMRKGEQEVELGDARVGMRELFESRLADTRLKLVQIDGTFRPAWFTNGDDADGEPYAVVLDAENGRVLSMHQANPGSDCSPSPLNAVTALGVPVRPELTNWRTMKASVASRPGGPEGFTHEAVWIPSDPGIRIIGYHSVDSEQYRCPSTGYTLFPLKITSANCCYPVYDDWELIPGNTPLYGRAMGDAMWHTYRTMFAFKYLGRNGWDGANGDAKVIVNAGTADQGQFMKVASYTSPANTVRIGPPSRMYSLAASLDLVGHEWGHGVIIKTANFNYSDPIGAQMHEGWADVIGTIVEKRTQGSGTGLEQSSDYKMHEDAALNGTYARGAIDDGSAGHIWVGPNGSASFNDRLHRQDTFYNSAHSHASGNMLTVAYLILSAGGSTDLPSGLNPICSRSNAATLYAGCDSANAITFNERLGPSKGGTLLFYAITNTVTSSTNWNDVADRVNEAAFARYNLCHLGPQYNAQGEQRAVGKAFAGIGYPRTKPDIQCP